MNYLKLRAVKLIKDANTGKEEVKTFEFGLWPVSYPLGCESVIASYNDAIFIAYVDHVNSVDVGGEKHLLNLEQFIKGSVAEGYTPQWYEASKF
jgi:hypothetical protein